MDRIARRPKLYATASMALVIALTAAPAARAAPGDPFEPLNRASYGAHQTLDHAFFGPAAHFFAQAPAKLREGVRNFIRNLKEPGVALNDLLQRHPARAARTFARFVCNTTVGVIGVFDVAAGTGLPHHDNGFANTFGVYGVKPGPYLFIPLFGPTTIRDLVGTVADIATDPVQWAVFQDRTGFIYGRAIVGGLDERAEANDQLKAIENMSTDSYASLRSLYLQNRAAEVATAKAGDSAAGSEPQMQLPDFDSAVAPGQTSTAAPALPDTSDFDAASAPAATPGVAAAAPQAASASTPADPAPPSTGTAPPPADLASPSPDAATPPAVTSPAAPAEPAPAQ